MESKRERELYRELERETERMNYIRAPIQYQTDTYVCLNKALLHRGKCSRSVTKLNKSTDTFCRIENSRSCSSIKEGENKQKNLDF
jgi:hypothetical protein